MRNVINPGILLITLAFFLAIGFSTTATAKTISVDDNGPADFDNIQAAIDEAANGDVIVVKRGRYTGKGNRDIDFSGKAVTVRSTNPNDPNIVASTIIDCNGSEYSEHRGFHFHTGEDPNAVVAGFTITRGVTGSGGGILCTNGSSPTIKNNIIKSNYILYDYDGGGGIGCWDGASPIISNNIICDNYCEPGGGGGGIHCYEAGSPKIVSNVFIGNHANFGGAIEFAHSNIGGLVENNLIIGNTASWAAGIACWGTGDITIKNNTIVDNMAAEYTGGVEIHYIDTVWVTNCIIWDNRDSNGGGQFAQIAGTSLNIEHCCIEGWTGEPGGVGNIAVDPCFVDLSAGDYHLKSQAGRWDANEELWAKDDVTSLCIDAGNPARPIGLEPFPNGGIINMGAYGGTIEASKSYFGKPPCETVVAGDINGDCIVNFVDFAFTALHWLEDNN